ncbi:MAG TPA: putative glycoside hydrolase [Polyangia bacterium]|jgi:hypothetical protein
MRGLSGMCCLSLLMACSSHGKGGGMQDAAVNADLGRGGDLGGATSPIALLPDTSAKIIPYADQLDNGYSDALVQFVATHFAGTQKMLKAENDRYRAVNPNWFLLHYRLGSSSGEVQYIHDDSWSSDWSDVTTHEDWFMHNMNNARHHDPGSDWDINDISNSGFRDYWVTSVIADIRATGAQGVFADSFEAGISGYGVTDPDTRFDGTDPANPSDWTNGDTWIQQKHEWSAYIEQAFAATPEQFLFVPNIGAMITGWANVDYSNIDGAMLEGFGYMEAPSDWVLGMNRAMALTAAGKFIIVQSYPGGSGQQYVDERDFLIGTYLLLKGAHTYINLGGSGVYWFPEYDLDFGAPKSGLPTDVSAYLANGVYERDFANGVVLVNPSAASVTVTLPSTMRQAQPTGGGATGDAQLDGSGNYTGGSVAFANVASVTLPPLTAALLLNP